MGITIYMSWTQPAEDEYVDEAERMVGRLDEQYHGGPYVTRVLAPEAFGDHGAVPIPSQTLAERLPRAVVASFMREAELYGKNEARDILMRFGLEPTLTTGRQSEVFGGLDDAMRFLANKADECFDQDSESIPVPPRDKWIELMEAAREYGGEPHAVVEFVGLATAKERETGEPIRVYACH